MDITDEWRVVGLICCVFALRWSSLHSDLADCNPTLELNGVGAARFLDVNFV